MKRNVLPILFLYIMICFCLTGCNAYNNTMVYNMKSEELSQENIQRIENAKNAYEVSDFLTQPADDMIYNESGDDETFDMYFNLMGKKEYFIVNHNNESYVLFNCEHAEYGKEMLSINKMTKKYDGDMLEITISKALSNTVNTGCVPDYSCIRCIVKLEQEISVLVIDNRKYEKYEGGYIKAGNRCGVVDENLNIIVPMMYNNIGIFDAHEMDETYYYMTTDEGMGLMDSEFQIILPPIYRSIYYASSDKFIVGNPSYEKTPDEWKIGIVDRNGNLVHEYIDGYITAYNGFMNDVKQSVYYGNEYNQGVIDSDLNIIIEPIYKYIAVFELEEQKDRFYVVENEKKEFAVIDSAGKQKTEFEKTSVYEVQTKYKKYLWGIE